MHDSILSGWRTHIREVLASLLAEGSTCALVCYPNHWNPGDSAIWCGTRKALAGLNVHVRYVCDHLSYSSERLKASVPHGPILILGGGSFGDVYPDETGLRQRVFDDFPDRNIIQLPQSIWFMSAANIRPMAERIGRLAQFTFLARDAESEAFARRHFGCRAVLCPDMAFALDAGDFSFQDPVVSVFGVLRQDCEAMPGEIVAPGQVAFRHEDWRFPGVEIAKWHIKYRLFLRLDGKIRNMYGRHANFARTLVRICWGGYERLAFLRAQRGVDFISRGHVLVTNRLHAHILCLFSDRQQVIIDTCNGKVRNYYDTWTHVVPRVHLASDMSDACRLVATLQTR
ncbi:MAG: polysaccharide pyruvyl transferase family protein [bacterium]